MTLSTSVADAIQAENPEPNIPDLQERVMKCSHELDFVLDKYDMQLVWSECRLNGEVASRGFMLQPRPPRVQTPAQGVLVPRERK
jgi:hypothetical protein